MAEPTIELGDLRCAEGFRQVPHAALGSRRFVQASGVGGVEMPRAFQQLVAAAFAEPLACPDQQIVLFGGHGAPRRAVRDFIVGPRDRRPIFNLSGCGLFVAARRCWRCELRGR